MAGMYNMIVTYNGDPVPETDEMKELQRYRTRDCAAGEYPVEIKAGETITFEMEVHTFYEVRKPGAYDVTVTWETFPREPDKSVTVKSNTITVVVPEPGAETPQ